MSSASSFRAGHQKPKRSFTPTVLCLAFICTIGIAFCQTTSAAETDATSRTTDPFQMLTLHREQQMAARLLRSERYSEAEKILRRSARRHPDMGEVSYALAILLARQGRPAAALDSLETAIEAGFGIADALERDVNLTALRTNPRFVELVERVRRRPALDPRRARAGVEPSLVRDTTAPVAVANTLWDSRFRILRSFFSFTPEATGGALVHQGTGPVARMLNRWYSRGAAAGNHGDLYDNRDRDHSNLKPGLLPQISYVEYSDAARAADTDYRINTQIFFNAITIGNSSLAVTAGPLWRSQPRLALTNANDAKRLYALYASNHLYVYPEHRDHDRDHGDLFPANTPYVIISQGSSGSDQPFVYAAGAILAAFQPRTKIVLRQKGLAASTVQMIFRRASHLVKTADDYLSGKAHPSAFQAQDIDVVAMIERANALTPDEVPPAVTLAVLEESAAEPGIDHFAQVSTERLFHTPGAIARVVRSVAHARRLVVSAERTRDPNGRPLAFRWVVLRGDAARIKITPLNAGATKAELIVPWHERAAVPGRPDLTSTRVDIAVFAHNGRQFSAPAFVSLLFPGNQLREYDGQGRILRIDYADPDRARRYVDPILFPARDWSDVYHYDNTGRLTGWTRRRGGNSARYTRHGARVVERDGQGRPTKAVAVRYALDRQVDGRPKVTERDTGDFFHYTYRDEADRYGTLRAAAPD